MSMAIHYTCRCGANIRLPGNVVGRKARCNSCGLIFTVPSPEAASDESAAIPLEPGLPEIAAHHKKATPAAPQHEPISLANSDREDILAPEFKPEPYLPPQPITQFDESSADLDGRTFWGDLARSFLFFLDGGNSVTLVFVTLIQTLAMGSNTQLATTGTASLLSVILPLVTTGYLSTFYLEVIKVTAGGEDELPTCAFRGFFEMLVDIVEFGGTWIWVLLPAAVFAAIEYFNYSQVNWTIVKIIAAVGIFFWPVVILGVAMYGSLGLWPHLVIRTVFAAPLAYLALCGVLLITAGLHYLPYADFTQTALATVSMTSTASWGLAAINAALATYATIVAMRAIGLYYYHNKRKFPWAAE